MSNDLSSSNDLLKMLNKTVMQDSWLKDMYGVNKADQQSELKKIFTVIADNDVTTEQKAVLETRKEELAEKVERLEAKMAVLEEELAKNEKVIKKHADEITDLITGVKNKSNEMEKNQKTVVKNAVSDVFDMYKNGNIEKDNISTEIKRRIQQDGKKDGMMLQIEGMLANLDAKQNQVQGLVDDATKWIDQRKILEAQYGVTKSTYELINANLAQIGATETNYTNSDYDTNIPVYSLEKTDIVSGFMENPQMNVEPGKNPNYVEGTELPELDDSQKTGGGSADLSGVAQKYEKYLKTPADGKDSYSYDNTAIKNLKSAIDEGMFEDMTAAGASYKDITDFLVDNFSGAHITYNAEGKLNVPYGHGDEARAVFGKVDEQLNAYNVSFKGALNTWDEKGGNTISSNAQIAALSNNYDEILTKMGTEEPKFTFKEAMYALFNPDTGLFKDSGVVYDASKQGEVPNYFIEFAGDDETAQMYKDMSDKIFDLWGVKPSRGVDFDRDDGDDVRPSDSDPSDCPVVKTDPVTFKMGDAEYAFVIDRDGDGAFSGASDFVGGDQNSTWLDDLKSLDTDGDGKLTGDELKNLKILGSEYTDNAQTENDNNIFNPKANQGDKEFTRAETTNIQYDLTNAQKMGIEEIDLTDLEQNVNQSTGKNDINGSEIFNDSFSFKMNGEEVTASRKDDTDAFMNAVYGDAYGKNFQVGLNEQDVDDIINKTYSETDGIGERYGDLFTNINILKSAPEVAAQARANYQNTVDRMNKEENIELVKAGNKAASYSNVSSWSSIQADVAKLAAQQGVAINMEQAKGIYVLNKGYGAQEVVNEYMQLFNEQKEIENQQATSEEAWNAIMLCAKNGVDINADEITKLLSSGEAKTAEDVLKILQEKMPPNTDINIAVNDIGELSEREQEIYNAFHNTFEQAGIHDKTVEALVDLCKAQLQDSTFMQDKTGEELAKEILKKYQGTPDAPQEA